MVALINHQVFALLYEVVRVLSNIPTAHNNDNSHVDVAGQGKVLIFPLPILLRVFMDADCAFV